MTAIWSVKLNCFIHTCMVIYKPICRYQLPLNPYALYVHLGKLRKKKHAFQKEKGKYAEHFAWNPRLFLGTHDFLFGTYDFFLRTHDFFLGTHDFLPTTHDFLPTTHDFLPTTHAILPTTHDC